MVSALSIRTFAASAVVLAFTIASSIPAAAALENRALGKPATSLLSSQCSAGSAPAKAVDGKTSNIYTDKWCATTVGASHLKIDLGHAYYLFTFTLFHAGAAGENPIYNSRDFSIRVSPDGLVWRTVVNITGNTSSVSSHAVDIPSYPGTRPPVYARYVELVVTRATQMATTLSQVTRIYELQAIGTDECQQYCV